MSRFPSPLWGGARGGGLRILANVHDPHPAGIEIGNSRFRHGHAQVGLARLACRPPSPQGGGLSADA